MNHLDIKHLKEKHPSLKLLNADNSPLIISFLYPKDHICRILGKGIYCN